MPDTVKPVFTEVSEQNRVYVYPDGMKIAVPNVRAVAVSKSGNHRLTGEGNKKYIVFAGFRLIEIEAEEWSF